MLSDMKDDMILELAIVSASEFIVTYNRRHFGGIDRFGIVAVTPREFLQQVGVLR